MSDNTHHILKILSGPHRGVEVDLINGVHTIGCTDDCDLIIHDASLGEEQLEIIVQDGMLGLRRLQPTDQILKVAGRSTDLTEFGIDNQQVIELGTFAFGFFAEGDSWQPVETQDDATQETDESPEPSNANTSSESKEIQEKPPEVSELVEGANQRSSRSSQLVSLITCAAVMLILGYGIGNFTSQDETLMRDTASSEQQNGTDTAEPSTKDSKKAYTVQKRQNRLVVRGFVANKKDKQRLLRNLKKQGLPVDENLLVVDELVKNARVGLRVIGFDHITARAGEPLGTIVLEGYNQDRDVWLRAKRRLQRDVPVIKNWQDQVDNIDSRKQKLLGMIEESGLQEHIKVTSNERFQLVIAGQIPRDQQPTWESVVKNFRERFQNQPELVNASSQTVNLAIQAISLGRIPYITLEDGRKVTVGGRIDESYVLHQILADQIILKHGSKLLNIYLESFDAPQF